MAVRHGPDLETTFMSTMWILYFARCVDDPRRWHCDCPARAHHRLIAWDCMEAMITIFNLEVNKCSIGSSTT